MEINLFLGRFHPLLVHLPIGFIVLAIILEILSLFNKNKERFDVIIRYTLIATILSGFLTVCTGLLLANGGGYNSDSLNKHKWLGIGVVVFSIGFYIFKTKFKNYSWKQSAFISAFLFILVSLTGHQGGVLTHGEGYLLAYAPDLVKKIAGISPTNSAMLGINTNSDSILVYRDMIEPIFQQKCFACHNNDKKAGSLSLTKFEKLFSKSENGIPIVKKKLYESEIYQRVSLPMQSDKFMPPKGKPLSYSEIKILEYWILQGADSTVIFDHTKMSSELINLMIRDYGLDYNPKSYLSTIVGQEIEQEKISFLRQNGYIVNRLGKDNKLLDIGYKGNQIDGQKIKILRQVSKNVAFLDLSNCGLTDDLLMKLPEFSHMTKLNLHSNPISGEGLLNLKKYNHLEMINLHDTSVSENGLIYLNEIASLRRVYLWKTKVTREMVDKHIINKNVSVDIGNAAF